MYDLVTTCDRPCDGCAAYDRFMQDAIAVAGRDCVHVRSLSLLLVDAFHGRAGDSAWAGVYRAVEGIAQSPHSRRGPARKLQTARGRLLRFLAQNRDIAPNAP